MSAALAADVQIFERVIAPAASRASTEVARYWLSVEFPELDRRRMSELAAAARAGTLTDAEREEADAYERVGAVLGILKSQSRARLRRAAL